MPLWMWKFCHIKSAQTSRVSFGTLPNLSPGRLPGHLSDHQIPFTVKSCFLYRFFVRGHNCSGKSNGKIEWGVFGRGGFSNSRFVLKPDVAIASEVSILSKNSLAITDFHARKTQHAPTIWKPPSWNPPIRDSQFRLQNAFTNRACEAPKLVPTETLLLKHYYRNQGRRWYHQRVVLQKSASCTFLRNSAQHVFLLQASLAGQTHRNEQQGVWKYAKNAQTRATLQRRAQYPRLLDPLERAPKTRALSTHEGRLAIFYHYKKKSMVITKIALILEIGVLLGSGIRERASTPILKTLWVTGRQTSNLHKISHWHSRYAQFLHS